MTFGEFVVLRTPSLLGLALAMSGDAYMAETDANGNFSIRIPGAVAAGNYLEGDSVNTDFDVFIPGLAGVVHWSSPLSVTGREQSAPETVAFDIGRRKITVDGQTSTLHVP